MSTTTPIPVSILIPARNEAKGIHRMLNSLDTLDYPREYLQILLANDNSTDETLKIMYDFAAEKNWITVVDIPERKPEEELKGKTRVLAMLAHQTTGQYLFFTDADVAINSQWVKGMLSELENNLPNRAENTKEIGVMVGVTGMKHDSFASTMQALEWFCVVTINKLFSDRNIPTTGMGNNMAVLKEAYFAAGGYEKIGFSIVEDYTLYKKIIAEGYDFRQVFIPEVVAYTVPPEDYFEQRDRWIQGAIESNSGPLYLGIMQAVSLPLYTFIAFFSWKASLAVFLITFCFYSFLVLRFESKLKLSGYTKYLPLFALYLPTSWLLQFLHYLFAKKIVWKGRDY
jgi:cellulose synthase/poly-beta-1,6-N-acetylglucosamine synthase-like glycosyltransferase